MKPSHSGMGYNFKKARNIHEIFFCCLGSARGYTIEIVDFKRIITFDMILWP